MPGASSLGHTLVVAGAVHVAVAVFVTVYRPPPRTVDTGEPPQKLIWVESTPDLAPSPEAIAPSPESVGENTAPRDPTRIGRVVPSTVGSAVALPESAPALPGGWTLHVTTDPGAAAVPSSRLAALALDGKNHFLGERSAASEADEDPERAARREGNRQAGEAMRAALHEHDIALGLGGGGPVVTALEAAALASTAPLDSRAIVIAVADASGSVTHVDIESASADPASFHAIAEDALARLRGQAVRVPAGAQGLSMRIEVVSRIAAPSGGGVGLDPKSAGAHFDLSDIGSRQRRVIHAHVIAEQIL
jgi:hypothetical protein